MRLGHLAVGFPSLVDLGFSLLAIAVFLIGLCIAGAVVGIALKDERRR